MVARELPQEIFIDIFSRLPAKSIGKCRCVAKSWRTLLSTPQFIKSHLTRGNRQENLIVIDPSNSIHSISNVSDYTVSNKLELPGNWAGILGSCDGLFLLVNAEDEKFLVNPTTQEQVKIQDSPLNGKDSFTIHGFGYDSSSDDYKVVTVSYYDTDIQYEPYCIDTYLDVYSVKMGVWKRVGCSPYDHSVRKLSYGVFVNGAIHWLAISREPSYRSVIAAFNLADEEFDEIPAPISVDVRTFVCNKLVALGGCLCMIDARSNRRTGVWIMKEYGLATSWIKFSIDADYKWGVVKPLCFIGEEDVVLLTKGQSLIVYDREEETLRDMVVDGVPAMFMDGGTFVESLVSPSFGTA